MSGAGPQLEIVGPFDRGQWRDWLAAHHAASRGVWLVLLKKHTGRPAMSYDDAVKEALCFGWIDSTVRSSDADSYLQKITPRTDRTKWSESNRRRLGALLVEGLVTPAGLAAVAPEVMASLESPPRKQPVIEPALSPELQVLLQAAAGALQAFDRLPPGQRRLHIRWIMAAVRDTTQRKRLDEVIGLLAQGKRLGLK